MTFRGWFVSIYSVLAVVAFVVGTVKLVTLPPLAVVAEWRRRRRIRRAAPSLLDEHPSVSVIIPAFNEATVLAPCIRSILASAYDRVEVVVVDDGSTDDTAHIMRAVAREDPRVVAVSQPNAGKGAALNTGIGLSHGDVLVFADADGIFLPNTIVEMLRGFSDDRVGAVCGDDRPVNPDRALTKLLALISHVGTGLVRRALALLGVLQIVSGNMGAFRRTVLEEIGPFRPGTVGEDLEITWRVHLGGYQVAFQPAALVYAESPSTVRGLWRQRVRWARGLLQTIRIHRRVIGNPRHGRFGPYLAFNVLSAVVLPVVLLLLLVFLPVMVAIGEVQYDSLLLFVLFGLGLAVAVLLLLLAVALNGAWKDLRFAWTIPMWTVYGVGASMVMVSALWKERKGDPAPWNKLDRTGVVAVEGLVTERPDGSRPPSSSPDA